MRHSYYGRKLSRTKNQRHRLLVGLTRDLILRGSIKTTVAKAKAVQPMVEKLVTLAKHGAVRGVEKALSSKNHEKLVLDDAKTRFASRTSGFTRIVRLGRRLGDATEEVLLQFVDQPKAEESKPETKSVRKEVQSGKQTKTAKTGKPTKATKSV